MGHEIIRTARFRLGRRSARVAKPMKVPLPEPVIPFAPAHSGFGFNAGRWPVFLLLLLCLDLCVSPLLAHEPSKSYLNLTLGTNQITGQWDIPLSGLQSALHLELDTTGAVSWKSFQAHYTNVTAYALAHL